MQCLPRVARGSVKDPNIARIDFVMKYKKRDEVMSRRIAGEVLLVPIKGNLADMQKLFVLEGVGEFIWERLDGNQTVQQLEDAVCENFEVMADDARNDIEEFIGRLKERGLIMEVN